MCWSAKAASPASTISRSSNPSASALSWSVKRSCAATTSSPRSRRSSIRDRCGQRFPSWLNHPPSRHDRIIYFILPPAVEALDDRPLHHLGDPLLHLRIFLHRIAPQPVIDPHVGHGPPSRITVAHVHLHAHIPPMAVLVSIDRYVAAANQLPHVLPHIRIVDGRQRPL